MANANLEILLIVFIGITALALLLQAGVLLGILLTVRKAVNTGKEEADGFLTKLKPMIDSGSQLIQTANELIVSTKTLISNVQPQIQSTVAELANMAHDVHVQANELQASVDEVAHRARHQVDRVDSMATSVLNGVDRFGSFLNEAVHMPLRQVNGIMAATRAVVDALRAPSQARPRSRPAPPSMRIAEDKDLFV
jgi:ABC-type transporter Mla subunit MlaD